MSGDASYDVVVLGAGAAGMMCAATAGQRGRRVLLIEHYTVLGEKIRISGGGRCNFTNIGAGPANYLSENPDFCRSALARYTPRDFLALLERHKIAYHEKKLGQLFCDHTARDIIGMLASECDRGRVEWWMPCAVDGIVREGDGFVVTTPRGAVRAPSVVIATGGLTVPKIGASPFGYRVAAEFGLSVVPPNSSSTTPCCSRSCFTFIGLACGKSTLLIATIIGTPAFLACEMASMVCGMTASSAATTRMTISVT